jgi:hypothetical protein
MSATSAEGFWAVLAVYLAVGVLSTTFIAIKGLERIDAGARDMPWSARLLILPGLLALWPLMLLKCLKQKGPPAS